MSSHVGAPVLRGLRRLNGGLSGALWTSAAIGSALGTGVAVSRGYGLYLVAGGAMVAFFALGLKRWRWSVYGLIAYLPFSGILTLALYPQTTPGVLAKDFLFVLPAYVGFFASFLARRRRIAFPGAPLASLGLLAAIVVAQAFNPRIPEPLVALIGLKVWLLYMPLLFLGYHLVATERQLRGLLTLMCVAAIVPAAVGIAEGLLIHSGRDEQVYALYGAAAGPATQEFAEVELGEGTVRRVPSTFSYVAQYTIFTAIMVCIAYAWWQGADRRRARFAGLATWILMLLAAFLSGSRGAFVIVPLLIALMMALSGRLSARTIRIGVMTIIGAVIAVLALGIGPSGLISQLRAHAQSQFELAFVTGFEQAAKLGPSGEGTGMDTGAARYAVEGHELYRQLGGWQESWWAKAMIELGVVGLLAAALLMANLLWQVFRAHLALRTPQLRVVSAAALAVMIWTVLYGVKAQYLDFDPLNCYFWLLAGIAMKLPRLEGPAGRT